MGRIFELVDQIDTIDDRLENETELRAKTRKNLKVWRDKYMNELIELRNV